MERKRDLNDKKLSIIKGKVLSGKELQSFTLLDALFRAVKKGEEKGLYFVSSNGDEEFFSYKELFETAKSILTGLRKQGIKSGNKIIIEIEDDKNFFCAFWASMLGGIISAPVSTPSTFKLESAELQKVVKVWEVLEKPFIITETRNVSRYQKLNEIDLFSGLNPLSVEELKNENKAEELHNPTPDEIAYLQFSSGSTGVPKGVKLTHYNLITNIMSICNTYKFCYSDVTVSWLPHTHDMGLIALHLTSVFKVMDQVKMAPQVFLRRPMVYLEKITEHKGTITAMPNFGLSWVLEKVKDKYLENINLSSIRVLSNGAEPISVKIMNNFTEKYKHYGFKPEAMCPVYGMAEASVALCFTPLLEEPNILDIDKNNFIKNGLIKDKPKEGEFLSIVDEGFPIDGVDIRVVDKDDNSVEENIVGHVQVRGPNVTQGYINNEEANKDLFCEGWLRTGDMGFVRNGRLAISGRQKEIIFVNGVNYYANDIEEIVYEIKKIWRGDLAAIGVYNYEIDTEEVIIFVKYKGSIEKFLNLREQILKKINSQIGIVAKHIIPVNKIPKTTSGKIQRYRLRKAYLEKEFVDVLEKIKKELQKCIYNRKNTIEPTTVMEKEIRKIWSRVLQLEEEQICINDNFNEIGGSSVKATQVLTELESLLDRELSHDILIDRDTIKEIAISLEEIEKDDYDLVEDLITKEIEKSNWVQKRYNGDIAVVGISLRFPGSRSMEEFWEHLKKGENLISKISADRQNLCGDKEWDDWLGYIDDVDKFDAEFFNISEEEAKFMDPQQRLILQVAYEALEDGNLLNKIGKKENIGVYVGASQNSYNEIILDYFKSGPNWDQAGPSTMVGNLLNMISARISHTFDFTGPALTIDTACSSSLTAVYTAVQSLRNGDIEGAVVGGTHLILTPTAHFLSKKAGILSQEGRCKVFGDKADGTVLGEGIGVVYLEPLEKALAAGREIYGVIKGVGANNDGSSLGIMAPNPDGQLRVLVEAYNDAKTTPSEVTYIEAHGTGTALGDPVEIKALSRFFGKQVEKKNHCGIGSVKSNIGHLLPAAGIAGFIKTLLCLKHKTLVPSINTEKLNPLLDIDETVFYITNETREWKIPEDKKRIAGISSFGFGGTNVHVVVEESPYEITEFSKIKDKGTEDKMKENVNDLKLLPISGKNPGAVYDLLEKYYDHFTKNHEFNHNNLYDICYNATIQRKHYNYRTCLVGESHDEIKEGISNLLSEEKEVFIEKVEEIVQGKLAFVFTGQGNQWFPMGRLFYECYAVFRKAIEKCDTAFAKYLDWSLIEVISNEEYQERLTDTEFAQPLIFGIQIALFALWKSWGIVPEGIIGHSLGEIAAAYTAGILNLEDAARVVVQRSNLMQQSKGAGKMAVIGLSEQEAENIIKKYGEGLTIAVINDSSAVVVAGKPDKLAQLVDEMKEREIFYRYISHDFAFHSTQMEPFKEILVNNLINIQPDRAVIPVYSTVMGEKIEGHEMDAAYWGDQLRNQVKFNETISKMIEDGFSFFVEIGPHSDLSVSILRTLDEMQKTGTSVTSLKKNNDENYIIHDSLGKLYEKGYELDWSKIYSTKVPLIKLPVYPWQIQKYWLEIDGVKQSQINWQVQPGLGNKNKRSQPQKNKSKSQFIKNKFYDEIKGLTPEDRTERIKNYIAKEIAIKVKKSVDKLNFDISIISLGLDSLVAIELKNKFERELGIDISIVSLMRGPTIAELASILVEEFDRQKHEIMRSKIIVNDEYQLSYGQQALWFIDKMAQGNVAYNINFGLAVHSNLDIDLLEKSLEEIIKRHKSLRTVYIEKDAMPVQKILEIVDFQLEKIDTSNWEQSYLDEKLKEFTHQTFNLEKGPAFRVGLFKRTDEHYILVFSFHHIAVDLWSVELIISDLIKLYNSDKTAESSLPKQDRSFLDYVEYQNRKLKTTEWNEMLEYWKNELSGELLSLNLPVDKSRPVVQTYNGSTYSFEFEQKVSKSLKDYAQKKGITSFTLLLGLYKLFLYRLSGQDDILVGTPTLGRNHRDFEDIVGYFVNPIVIRSKLSGKLTFDQFLDYLNSKIINGLKNQAYPFNLLVGKIQPERDLNRNPIFQTMFVLEKASRLSELSEFILGQNKTKVNIGELELEPYLIEKQASQFDLTLIIAEGTETISASFEYNTDIFYRSTIERFAEQLKILAENVVRNHNLELTNIPILTQEEYQWYVYQLNETSVDYPVDQCIHQMFEEYVASHSESTAVADKEQSITYGQLNKKANRLAHYLKAQGVGPDVIVGLRVERSIEMIVSMLAVLKAGGAYMPIDVDYPIERVNYMLEDADSLILLTNTDLDLKMSKNITFIDIKTGYKNSEDESNLNLEVNSSNLVYVIYTSGSTGKPKGVMVEHSNLVSMIFAHRSLFKESDQDRISQIASISFDACAFEIWPALTIGAELHIADDQTRNDPFKLKNWLVSNQINIAFAPTPIGEVLLTLDWHEKTKLRSLRIAGDKLHNYPDKELHFKIYNLYGPTEATIWTTYYRIPFSNNQETPPIGRPIDNVQVYVLDENMKPCPEGVKGEIYIGGNGITRGYIKKAALNSKVFLPDPFVDKKDCRLYKTGDLGYYLPDGNLSFAGRKDHQVKIRGFRIELEEIETVINHHPLVKSCAVLVKENSKGLKQLIGYISAKEKDEFEVEKLRNWLKNKIPDYMIPYIFVVMDKLPLTTNGKIDRKSFPEPPEKQEELHQNYVTPRNELEEKMVEIWSEVLEVSQIGIYDNFFTLGGNSLFAIQLISRIKKNLNMELSVDILFDNPVIAELVEYIESNVLEKISEQPKIERVPRDEDLPLSFAQQRLWFLYLMDPESVAYNIPVATKLTGKLDIEALKWSINSIIKRHEILRSNFTNINGQPGLSFYPVDAYDLLVIDLSDLSKNKQEKELLRIVREDGQNPFNLFEDKLIRANLLRLNQNEHVLIITMHHIVSDGWSLGLFIKELAQLYEGYSTGTTKLTQLPVQYVDYAAWQHRWLQGAVLEKQLSYWKEKICGSLPVLELPADYTRGAVQTFNGDKCVIIIPADLTSEIKKLCESEELTLFMLLLSVYKILLYRYTQQNDIIVGSPIANRNHLETEDLIGFFINTLVLRSDLSGEMTFRELVKQVRKTTLEAYAHQDLPFEKLVEELHPDRNLSNTPLFQVMFNMLNFPNRTIELPGLTVDVLIPPENTSKFDMTMYAEEKEDEIKLELVYNADVFAMERMEEMLSQYQLVLNQIINNPVIKIDNLSLITDKAQKLLPAIEEIIESKEYGPIFSRYSQVINKDSSNMALVDSNGIWTYQMLEDRSNQLANYLIGKGIKPEDRVAVYSHRSSILIWALLGILKAGAAFVILDPNYPRGRLLKSMEISKPKGVLHIQQAGSIDIIGDYFKLNPDTWKLELPDLRKAIEVSFLKDYSTRKPDISIDPESTAYISFTSGSSGQPKAIIGTHNAVSHFIDWYLTKFNIDAEDRFSMLSGLAHDPLLRDIFVPLSFGACLYIPDPEMLKSPDQLLLWIKEKKITVSHLTPALGQLLIDVSQSEDENKLSSLRYLFFGGETLMVGLVKCFKEINNNLTIINSYGATETPQIMGYYQLTKSVGKNERKIKENVPLGQGIDDVQILVLNRNQRLAGIGELGEIYIRTPYLAKGYLNDSEKTKRFIINPLTDNKKDRLFRTGDLGRYLPDGTVEYLGRLDNQINIRGYRIEPGEIRNILNKHPQVKDSIINVYQYADNDKRLIAYVVTFEDNLSEPNRLKNFLKDKLPEYMIPQSFMEIDSIPLTPNGKVNFKALPEPKKFIHNSSTVLIKPETKAEKIIAEIWSEILKISEISRDDNFFEIGGHSMLLAKLHNRLQENFDKEFSIVDLFKYPTISSLAEYLTGDNQSSENSYKKGVSRAEKRKKLQKNRRRSGQRVK